MRRLCVCGSIDEARLSADHLDMELDETHGYPALISIDWEERTADDEIVFRAERLETPR